MLGLVCVSIAAVCWTLLFSLEGGIDQNDGRKDPIYLCNGFSSTGLDQEFEIPWYLRTCTEINKEAASTETLLLCPTDKGFHMFMMITVNQTIDAILKQSVVKYVHHHWFSYDANTSSQLNLNWLKG